MPIEIKELHIKIDVDNKEGSTLGSEMVSKKSLTRIMKSCIEEMQTIQSRKNER